MKARFGTIAAVLLLSASVSCDLFETRDPVEPSSSQFPCRALSTPDSVVVNILIAYGHPDGLGCYVSNLADFISATEPGFRFHPDPTDSSEAPAGVYDAWGKSVEDEVAANIANAADQDYFQLIFKFPYEVITDTPNFVGRRYTYEIKFKGTAIPDTLFQGIAELYMTRTAGDWRVTDWFDRRDPGGTTTLTWGFLRGSYRF